MICQLVLEYFQLQLSDILFFLEAFGLFGIFWPSKGLTAFLRPKNPKKASGLQKKQNVFKLQLKILQKKLTHHEKMPAFFLSLVPYHIDAHSSMIIIYILKNPLQKLMTFRDMEICVWYVIDWHNFLSFLMTFHKIVKYHNYIKQPWGSMVVCLWPTNPNTYVAPKPFYVPEWHKIRKLTEPWLHL